MTDVTESGTNLEAASSKSSADPSGGNTGEPPDSGAGRPGASSWRSGRNLTLSLAALGVVYGDIGTSPLYALRESALAAGGPRPDHFAILGAMSLIFWSLIAGRDV